ncbi:MAG: hypothetical protein ACI8P9_003556 [Parasphingorhabdus sp.]|jgi:hypothetical protein
MNREKLIRALDEIDMWEPSDESVVETIRKIRQAQSENPVANHQ